VLILKGVTDAILPGCSLLQWKRLLSLGISSGEGPSAKKRAADMAAALQMQSCTSLFYQTNIEIKENFGVVNNRSARENYFNLTIID
jgi:hypothetical protein